MIENIILFRCPFAVALSQSKLSLVKIYKVVCHQSLTNWSCWLVWSSLGALMVFVSNLAKLCRYNHFISINLYIIYKVYSRRMESEEGFPISHIYYKICRPSTLHAMDNHSSLQLPVFSCFHQYFLLYNSLPLWYLLLHPFTKICPVSFHLLLLFSLCLVSAKFSMPLFLIMYVSLKISAVAYWLLSNFLPISIPLICFVLSILEIHLQNHDCCFKFFVCNEIMSYHIKGVWFFNDLKLAEKIWLSMFNLIFCQCSIKY